MIDLYQPGAYCRTAGGNLERPAIQSPVVRWMAWSINSDNGGGGSASVWDRCRSLWSGAGIQNFPWLHCRSLADIQRLLDVASMEGSPAIGLNIEDVKRDFTDKGISLQDIAQKIAGWSGEVHMATLPWVQNGQGWSALKRCVAALEFFPDEQQIWPQNTYSPEIARDCFQHAGDEGLTKVTVMWKTKGYTPAAYGDDFSICHSLYTADDIPPSAQGWMTWRLTGPCERLGPVPVDNWWDKPYPKGKAVGPAKLPRPLYPRSAKAKGKEPSVPGPDVVAFKRAMVRAQRWDRELSELDNVYYDVFAHGKVGKGIPWSGIAGFQRQEGIAATGWLGDATYQAIRRSLVPVGPNKGKPLLDERAIALLGAASDMFVMPAKLAKFYDWLDWLAVREPSITYSQQRPIQPLRDGERPPNLPTPLDCSGSLIYASWLAELQSPDPNGYTGYGNTDSLRQRGEVVPAWQAAEASLKQRVFAFYQDSDHVVAVLPDGKVWSHGMESGPDYRDSIFYRGGFVECRAYPN